MSLLKAIRQLFEENVVGNDPENGQPQVLLIGGAMFVKQPVYSLPGYMDRPTEENMHEGSVTVYREDQGGQQPVRILTEEDFKFLLEKANADYQSEAGSEKAQPKRSRVNPSAN